jgi:hypothetical protein
MNIGSVFENIVLRKITYTGDRGSYKRLEKMNNV